MPSYAVPLAFLLRDLNVPLQVMGAAKALMEMLGVPVGPARLPNTNLTAEHKAGLRGKLEAMGFFEWIK